MSMRRNPILIIIIGCVLSVSSIWICLRLYKPLNRVPIPMSSIEATTIFKRRHYVLPSVNHSADSHSNVSYDAVIRSAFINIRTLPKSKHTNRTIIFAEVSKELRKFDLIDGCGVDAKEAETYQVVPLHFDWLQLRQGYLTHEEIMIVCYDLQANENSTAFFRYRPSQSSESVTTTINVTYIKREKESNPKTGVVICTLGFGKPPFLKEWLMYQKTIGANLVQMYAEETFMSDKTNQEIVQSYVQEGFLKIEKRKTYFNQKQIFYHSQILNYNDCLYRYQGVYEYAFFLDTDDFFMPQLETKTLGFYLNKLFFKKNRAEVRFRWFTFFPDCGYTRPLSSLKDGNVTAVLAYQGKVKENSKFVCRPMLTEVAGVHTATTNIKGTTKFGVSNEREAYVAHVRLNRLNGIPNRDKCNVTAYTR